MFCEKCGNEMEDGSEFCESCGEKVVTEEIQEEVVANTEEEIVVEEETKKDTEIEEKPIKVKKEKAKKPEQPTQPTPERQKAKKVLLLKPLGIFSFLWMFILMLIPPVNIIMLLVWALGSKKNENKKNFAWAGIILILLGVIGWLLAAVVLVDQFQSIIDSIVDIFNDIF